LISLGCAVILRVPSPGFSKNEKSAKGTTLVEQARGEVLGSRGASASLPGKSQPPPVLGGKRSTVITKGNPTIQLQITGERVA